MQISIKTDTNITKNKEYECTMCNSTLTIPYYKCCFDTYRRVCSKCLFTQKLDDLEKYKDHGC